MGIVDSMLKLGWLESITFEALVGHTIAEVEMRQNGEYERGDEIHFTLAPAEGIPDGLKLKLHHYQDCCESVWIEDVVGEWDDIIGSPLTMAEESTNRDTSRENEDWSDESFTWTFYKLATVKGYVTIRWYGTSNGYYSEEVSLSRASDD